MVTRVLFKKHVREVLELLGKHEELYFSEISELLGVHQGSLSRVMKELTDEKFIEKRKEEKDVALPKAYYALTKIGKTALDIYDIVNKMEKMQKEL
ncbi:MarR family transcriptional regulator [Methanococcus maripaludis]|uniref:DNA-binding HxlR family transcriptional regulator n=1 Tax=Methanococcus maripaludis TaxID=39152 RepID=A0A7J9PMM1_METMI|nr:helix-turn-helix domain-containing protein [Methanococcus maripaludis]MBA2864024.1 DNA-binding HxlR family transcriptional regulator [Methanococcus maripaludis]